MAADQRREPDKFQTQKPTRLQVPRGFAPLSCATQFANCAARMKADTFRPPAVRSGNLERKFRSRIRKCAWLQRPVWRAGVHTWSTIALRESHHLSSLTGFGAVGAMGHPMLRGCFVSFPSGKTNADCRPGATLPSSPKVQYSFRFWHAKLASGTMSWITNQAVLKRIRLD